MADIDWPLTLPKPRAGELSENPVAAFVNDAVEVGAARRRARFTRKLMRFSFGVTLSTAQAAALRTFVLTTTDGGVDEFNWTHPVTAATYEVRFANLPEIAAMTPGAWRAQIDLEEI